MNLWRYKILSLLVCFVLIFGIVLKDSRATEFLPTAVEVIVTCGDGLAEAFNGEVCDPGDTSSGIPQDVGSTTCASFLDNLGNPFTQGSISCLNDCSDYFSSACHTCGNAYKEIIEECDEGDFGGQSCLSFGFDEGNLLCTTACQISTQNCVARETEGSVPGTGGNSGGSSGVKTGYLPGGMSPQETKVIIRGKSYPHADVHILIDGKVLGIVQSDALADFYFETGDVTPGVASFGFWSEDSKSMKSTLLSLTFRVVEGAVTNISGVYISPSIDIDKNSVKQGEAVKIFGQTVPKTEVNVHVNSEKEHVVATSSLDDGNWELTFNTELLEEDFHTAKALFKVGAGGNIIKSGFSRSVGFYVGKNGGDHPCPEADLNHDDRVNITDFSILLYNWGTNNACADQNQNGTVDLVDFSVMMYYWTG